VRKHRDHPDPAQSFSTFTRRARVVVGVGLLAVRIAGELWFSSPPPFRWSTKAPAHADAVVVLSGDWGDRLNAALPLVQRGVAPSLVFAGATDSPQARDLCAGGQPFEVVCFVPNPDGTRPEARAMARLAKQRGWRHLLVVTSKFHATRAGMLFRRCFSGTIDVLGTTPPYSGRIAREQMWREWLGRLYYGFIDRGC
jgi:uncharacterized SAM-binding protein YcdF (DUF218 family)